MVWCRWAVARTFCGKCGTGPAQRGRRASRRQMGGERGHVGGRPVQRSQGGGRGRPPNLVRAGASAVLIALWETLARAPVRGLGLGHYGLRPGCKRTWRRSGRTIRIVLDDGIG